MPVLHYQLNCGILHIIFVLIVICAPAIGQVEMLEENAPNWSAALQRVPEADRASVSDALTLAGTRAPILVNVLLSVPDAWVRGAAFLIANMPMEDLAVITEDLLINNLRIAYEVRAEFSWASKISESDFFHYVLPMRVSQEPLEDWRGFFLEQLRPRVQNLKTIEEVAVEVNRWCGERVGFKPTQRRDQGPFETLRSGYGRCEEMMIVFVDACRAVGVPARQAWTPYWGFCDNNHAWAEVLCEDGRWRYAGACEPSNRLNDAWFNDSAKRANLILSIPFGLIESNSPDIYKIQDKPGARFCILNSTPYYRPCTELTVSLVDVNGEPLPGMDVYLSVFNFGALRPIANGKTDESGKWKIQVGPGGFFISAGDQTSGACMALNITETGSLEVKMKIGLGAELPKSSFWLRYPVSSEDRQ